MADGRHFEKTVKSLYLCDRSTDFDELWRNDAHWPLPADQSLKFRILKIQHGGGRHLEKITKIAISPQRFDWSSRNLACLCKMGLVTFPTVKKLNFTNLGWRTAAILKKVKLPYLCNRLTDFDEIWHVDACSPPSVDRPLKFRIFENPKWRRPPSWKSQKLRFLSNGLTDLYELWYADA